MTDTNDVNNTKKNEINDEGWIPTKMLPLYFTELFEELYTEDGLMVLGRGLGWLSLLAAFIRWYSEPDDNKIPSSRDNGDNADKTSPPKTILLGTKPPLVFVIGLRETERTALLQILESWDTPPELLPTMITNESGQGKDREGKVISCVFSFPETKNCPITTKRLILH
jgi:hypothetical protein